ncbi:FG-GAP-like repeat-containing protein [Streptomyces sp. NBC_00328]|uniref:FG-GAP-like repeat-containing protein n=1 Tax=Streptomyces sp. NBC_00328 TaxID=2903646 RepID=UPI002E2D9DE3|nr:FG-GAP-like repeat-containing protein [Streptomyces sp. NBC_00328]
MPHRRSLFARRRPFVIGAGVALAAGALAVPAVNAATVPTTASATPSAKRLHDDFNGDGYPDLAIGAPGTTVGGLKNAGSVSVLYGASGGLSTARKQVLTWPGRVNSDTPEYVYGSGLQSADLDGDGYADLLSAVDVSRMDIDDGYAVVVNWGGAKGLSATATALAWSPGAEWQGQFAVGDVDGDKHPDLVTAGAEQWLSDDPDVQPEEDGTVRHGPFTRGGGNAGRDHFTVDPQKALFNPVMAAGDVTGDGVADLAVTTGDTGSRTTALLAGGRDGFTDKGRLHDAQGRAVAGEDIAIGDLDKDGYGDVVVGRSAVGGTGSPAKGGAVGVVHGGPGGVSTTRKPVWISQDTPGVPGTDEKGDGMGAGLSVGDTDGDGYLDVATGLPGEDVGTTVDAGGVLVLRGSASGLTGTGAKSFTQSTSGVPGTAERMDRFGAETALADGNGDKKDGLIVGDPDENAGNGAVWTFSAGSGGITASGSASFGGSTLGLPATGSGFGRSLDD